MWSLKISDERFAKMTANYQAEQQTLESRVAELKSTMITEKLFMTTLANLTHQFLHPPQK